MSMNLYYFYCNSFCFVERCFYCPIRFTLVVKRDKPLAYVEDKLTTNSYAKHFAVICCIQIWRQHFRHCVRDYLLFGLLKLLSL